MLAEKGLKISVRLRGYGGLTEVKYNVNIGKNDSVVNCRKKMSCYHIKIVF